MSGFVLTTHADHNPLVCALRQNGVDVRHMTWGERLPSLSGCLAFYGNLFDEIKDWAGLIRFKAHLKRNCVPYVFWNRDSPWNTGIKKRNAWALKLINPVDIYLAHSLQDAEIFGGEPHYFPNAAQSVYFDGTDLHALRNEAAYAHDVSFFGSFGSTKDKNAKARLGFLSALECKLKDRIPLVRFNAFDTTQSHMSLDQQLEFIRTTKINLNYGAMCDLPNNFSWGLPERVFGIPAAGGFLLTEDRKMLKPTFKIAPESFQGIDECVAKIEYWLSNFNMLRNLAESVHEEVIDKHTYQSRAARFLEILHNSQSAVFAK